MATVEQLGSEKYVLLTTFRKDGRAVGTPLWVASVDGGLGFWTPTNTGKIKRIRNNARVTVQPCDVRGNPSGEPVEAHARIGDRDDWARVREAMVGKYGLTARLTFLGSRIRRGERGTVAVLVN